MQISEKVQKYYPEEKSTYVARQINTFVSLMKKDDIVLILNEKSKIISFGIIKDDVVYEHVHDTFKSIIEEGATADNQHTLKKRRSVRWIKHVDRIKLGSNLYRIIYSHSTIVNAKDYGLFMDRELSCFYWFLISWTHMPFPSSSILC